MKINHNRFLNLAFELARINLGKTKSNPSVGCVVVKNGSVISSGYTSINGRPHAEFNALNKKINFNNSSLYLTMEPCTHYGLTPPCTNIIIKKNIKKVYFSFYDKDKRTSKKSAPILRKKNIKIYKKNTKFFKNFYESYFNKISNQLPLLDAKIALSKDYYSINKKDKWITNSSSRLRAHLLRSEYDSIISTSLSINKDNSLLNCRLRGYNNKKPNLIIIDLKLKIKTNLNLFKFSKKRRILLVTSVKKDKKISYLKKHGVEIIFIDSLDQRINFIKLLNIFKIKGFNRILVETGLTFLNELLKNKLIFNLYMFKSSTKLGRNGFNNSSVKLIKKFNNKKKIKVNLKNDQLYKIKVK